MPSSTVSGPYAKLNIAQSHSRPRVSNDNPYSESAFKTLKYCPAFPGEFGSIQDANSFCEAFFAYYNTEHRHSGIAMHTPDGLAVALGRSGGVIPCYITDPCFTPSLSEPHVGDRRELQVGRQQHARPRHPVSAAARFCSPSVRGRRPPRAGPGCRRR
jgi:Integrase core domain